MFTPDSPLTDIMFNLVTADVVSDPSRHHVYDPIVVTQQ